MNKRKLRNNKNMTTTTVKELITHLHRVNPSMYVTIGGRHLDLFDMAHTEAGNLDLAPDVEHLKENQVIITVGDNGDANKD